MLLTLSQGGRAADSISRLQTHGRDLSVRMRAAELELYALDSRLENAGARLASLQAQAAALARARTVAALQLSAARATLAVARARLGVQLRALYEQEQPSFVSVLLSASSLDAAVQSFDDLTRAASSTDSVIAQAQAAQKAELRLTHSLRTRAAEVSRLQRAATATAASFQQAQADRQALIDRLRNEQALNDRQLASSQARAGAAVARAHTATLEAATAASPVSFGAQAPLLSDPQRSPASVPATAGSGALLRTLVVSSTGYSLPGSTAIGLPVAYGIVAVDPTVIPLGTRMVIPGYGEGTAADTGSAVRGYDIDLWFPTYAQAAAWGRRTVTIRLY